MDYGFIRAASATPRVKVADCGHNGDQICRLMDEMHENGAQMAVFPELCITGYTCGDLFCQDLLLENAKKQLIRIAGHSKGKGMVVIVGLPFRMRGKLYNTAAVINEGQILGMVPKKHIPNYGEFYEARHFSRGFEVPMDVQLGEEWVPMGMNLIFQCGTIKDFSIAVEICEDVWSPNPPATGHALAGATVIANLSASSEVTGKDEYRSALISGQSARTICGYVYSDAGEGESSTDLVFSAHNIIAENGNILAEAVRFKNETVYADIDVGRLASERRKNTTFQPSEDESYRRILFGLPARYTDSENLKRFISPAPFVPSDEKQREKRCEEILNIQAAGLKKRIVHTCSRTAVIGISGGLDSTLALLVTVRAFDDLNKDRKDILAVTMPGFGTTDRTYENAVKLIRKLGATFMEIPIAEAVNLHFSQIGHDPQVHDATYENSQARQRTMLLMNLANQHGGLVVGTGDMSELALGWATYNGDHMSMYGVNASVPKTLVRHLVLFCADISDDKELQETLYDVLDTPVSPELLPPKDGKISQKTEDLVGPYELHDFFLYYVLRFGFAPLKVRLLSECAFRDVYDKETITKWLKIFYQRFFSQQFKRSCVPDGPKVGSVALSPRGDLRMPSDASSKEWLDELNMDSY
ncbi:NAD(+) synthase [Parasporobacterium paucivorans]|uniref:Glutamine-dependent NAD(+) synthetase n=1 Tax=Parasporobacterium paucivorans DSM 15970 TaxID=1122934 RepID=A0A1M6CB44_9FIRM|nr:NAD(+) synthase [Parasporobacterium paucivorans]SHI58216.1 NAD+ synthase (glutamine-hydrolysing) [Parasporobacterium paucivorans DSM 15970]